jgi:hypothetical protein
MAYGVSMEKMAPWLFEDVKPVTVNYAPDPKEPKEHSLSDQIKWLEYQELKDAEKFMAEKNQLARDLASHPEFANSDNETQKRIIENFQSRTQSDIQKRFPVDVEKQTQAMQAAMTPLLQANAKKSGAIGDSWKIGDLATFFLGGVAGLAGSLVSTGGALASGPIGRAVDLFSGDSSLGADVTNTVDKATGTLGATMTDLGREMINDRPQIADRETRLKAYEQGRADVMPKGSLSGTSLEYLEGAPNPSEYPILKYMADSNVSIIDKALLIGNLSAENMAQFLVGGLAAKGATKIASGIGLATKAVGGGGLVGSALGKAALGSVALRGGAGLIGYVFDGGEFLKTFDSISDEELRKESAPFNNLIEENLALGMSEKRSRTKSSP